MTISPQAQKLYQSLLDSPQPLSAKQLASSLGILPNAVYRLTKPLIQMGLISKNQHYPHQFTALSLDDGLSLFLMHQNDWFSHQFQPNDQKHPKNTPRLPSSQQMSLSFIKSRDELMRLSIDEINHTNKSIDLLRSGHEIPADVMLAMLKAHKRGVVSRMLVQDYSPDNAEQISYWQKNGIHVRLTPLRHVRLMLYDSKVTYFMSYKHTDSQKDAGMHIDYPPFATILSQLFNAWWQKADKISK